MSETNKKQILESIYTSLNNNNEDIDLHIATLKEILATEKTNVAIFDAERLAQNNRAGRKMMQSYFKKRGVIVEFSK